MAEWREVRNGKAIPCETPCLSKKQERQKRRQEMRESEERTRHSLREWSEGRWKIKESKKCACGCGCESDGVRVEWCERRKEKCLVCYGCGADTYWGKPEGCRICGKCSYPAYRCGLCEVHRFSVAKVLLLCLLRKGMCGDIRRKIYLNVFT